MGSSFVAWCLLCLLTAIRDVQPQAFYQPEQIHLSYAAKPTEMVFTWVTFTDTGSVVEYGLSSSQLDMSAKGASEEFRDGGKEKRIIFMHRVTVTGLSSGQMYNYHVGSPNGWSSLYTFTAMKNGTDFSTTFALYGDLGNGNGRSMGLLQKMAETGKFDFVVHTGDFAYDMHDDNARKGDQFMRQIESIATYVPYMTCVGNHEAAYNFSNYKYRFTMPDAGGDGRGLWYSYDVGPVHFIAWDTEVYYENQGPDDIVGKQYGWLEEDLIKANRNREMRPWIITYGHRPMYCSNTFSGQKELDHCINPSNPIRVGDPSKGWQGVENLFYKYGVDVQVAAHEHSYERMWPVYNMRVCNGSRAPYTNPNAPVHIVTGSAGNSEHQSPFFRVPWVWSAKRSDDYGFNIIKVHNKTHINIQFLSQNKDGAIIDEIMLIKDQHGEDIYTCGAGMDTDYDARKKSEFQKIVNYFEYKAKKLKEKERRMQMENDFYFEDFERL
ncbi:acid phosphatase type 7-like [Lineus longissimus]|uniref:acid phosphatase type 7-like n=1 Tax=Lineus longissimus TaxID=88925 RepID=UPI002B4E7677